MRLKFLFFFIFFNSIYSQNNIYFEKIDKVKIDENYKLINIDNFNNKYFQRGNQISKEKNLTFSDLSLGNISSIDLNDPMKIKIWYSDYNNLIVLDNYLNEITRINFNNILFANNISHISTANDNNVWVFDETDMKIKKFDFFNRVFIDNVETKIDGALIDFQSDYNYLWVLTDEFFYKINYNGSIIYSSENNYRFSKISLFRNDIILLKNNQLVHFKNGDEIFVNIIHEKLFIKDFSVINETLYIYDEDYLNKYLILTY
tara:strand:- start:480 stop:1259 length:780 start_codon:yes stop_codon:yes gene_type:complete